MLPSATSPPAGPHYVNVSNSIGTLQAVMIEQLQWFATKVVPEFDGSAPTS